MTHTTTDTTNADLRRLVAAQTEAIREIAKERNEADATVERLESDLRTWRVLFALTLGAFVGMVFAFMGVVCR